MKLDPDTLASAREHLLAEGSGDLIRFMANMSLGLPNESGSAEAAHQAEQLNWIEPGSGQRTDTGFLISDSCREYLFWKERNRCLPFENALPFLERRSFEGRYVAEIGAGMGTNLMSLAGTARRLCGVEPIEAYVQLGQIFREREGIEDVQIRIGGAERLPFEDAELDLVLCVSAHQYFDIRKAFPEIARVTRPGGEVIIMGASLGSYGLNVGRNVLRSGGRQGKDYVITMINTLGYQMTGRRLLKARSEFSTSRPVYPSIAYMTKQLHRAGFETREPPQPAAGEICFYMGRR